MKIALTSESIIKLNAVKTAYSSIPDVQICGYKTDSGVGEQPIGTQILDGARNRINDLMTRVSDVNRIISIENGIFQESGIWYDQAIVLMRNLDQNDEFMEKSDLVEFPYKFVEQARARGFNTTTVGEVMAEEGYIQDAKDPHKSISGIPREKYLINTVQRLVNFVEN